MAPLAIPAKSVDAREAGLRGRLVKSEFESRDEPARPATGRDQNRIGAQGPPRGPGARRHPSICSKRYAPLFLSRQGGERLVERCARLDFDKCDRRSTLRDNIDLAAPLPR